MDMTEQAGGILHPRAAEMIARAAAADEPPLHLLDPSEARRIADTRVAGAPLRKAGMSDVCDVAMPGPAGDLTLRIYRPAERTISPFTMFFHGGGFMLGTLETHDALCRALAERSGAVVIAVEFRLAPEHVFPAALEDCLAATQWVLANCGDLSLDPARYALAGESSGGNLAAAVALRIRDKGLPAPRLQLLLYPFLDASLDYDSYREFAEGYLLTTERSRFYVDQYLGDHDPADPHASPLRDGEPGKSPPTFLLTAGCDPTRDPALAYAEKLARAGVEVEAVDFPGWTHGFLFWGDEDGSLAAIARAGDALARAFKD